MLAIKIWNYLKGYVIIRIEGLAMERLLNLALSNDVYLWDLRRLNYFQVEVCVSLKGLATLEDLIEKTGCKGEILQQRGFPKHMDRIKNRKMFFIGFLLFFLITFILTSFIWKIEINGVEQTPVEEVVEYLNDKGILSGTHKSKLDEEEVKLLLINGYDYFSFIDVKIRGIKLIIDIKEEDIPPEEVNKDYPANIVAKKKGVIINVIARNGDSVVKEGQVVRENQLLISGAIENQDGSYNIVHADGEVIAKTTYETKVSEPILKKIEKETGRVFTQRGLKINNRGILIIKDIPFNTYKEYIVEDNLFNIDSIDLPIKFITYEYRETEIREVKQNIETIKNSNQLKAIEIINKELSQGAEIVSRDIDHEIEGNILTTRVTVETLEDIGRKAIIN